MLQKKIFDSEQIRSTAEVKGGFLSLRNYQVKTLIIENDLNQEVEIQCVASGNEDMSKSFEVGTAFTVGANVYTYQTCDASFPYFNVTAKCSTAPTSGGLTIHLVGVS